MRDVGYIAAASHGESQRDHDQNADKVFRLDQKWERNHHDFVFSEEDSEGKKDREDASRRANRRSGWAPEDARIRERNRRQGRANHPNKIEFQKPPLSPLPLDRGTKHPQSKHV